MAEYQRPAFEITLDWGITDGSAPNTVTVTWGTEVPATEHVCAIIEAMAATGNRYTVEDAQLTGPPGGLEQTEPFRDPMDTCRRPSCGHPRGQHRGGTAGCTICEESTVCPSFWDKPAENWTGGA